MTRSNAEAERRRRFERVVTVFHAALFRYAAWLSRDRAVAEVVVQESLLRAWKSFDGLRDDSKARQWLLTIVRRENARYFESRSRERAKIDDQASPELAADSGSDDAELAEMRRAISRLDDTYREPLVLQVLMGYSTNEIAEILGITQGAVLTRLCRARTRLKEMLDSGATATGEVGAKDAV